MQLKYYPQYIFEYTFEYKEGFRYKEPIERVNGHEYNEYPEDSFERQNWAKMYWENHTMRTVNDICRFDSSLWKEEYKESIFMQVYEFESDPDRVGFSTTTFFDFELFLINEGYTLQMGMLGSNGGRGYKKESKWYLLDYGVNTTSFNINGEITKEYYKFAVTTNNFHIRHMPTKIEEFESFLNI